MVLVEKMIVDSIKGEKDYRLILHVRQDYAS